LAPDGGARRCLKCLVGDFAEEIFVGLVEFGGAVVHKITPLRLLMLQQFRQLCNVRRDAPGLVAREEVRRRATARLLLKIHVGERLPVGVADDEAGVASGCRVQGRSQNRFNTLWWMLAAKAPGER
jgi:hypothetical protein